MKANLGRKIIKLSSEIEDQISVIMTSKPCSSFDISLSLSLSLCVSHQSGSMQHDINTSKIDLDFLERKPK